MDGRVESLTERELLAEQINSLKDVNETLKAISASINTIYLGDLEANVKGVLYAVKDFTGSLDRIGDAMADIHLTLDDLLKRMP